MIHFFVQQRDLLARINLNYKHFMEGVHLLNHVKIRNFIECLAQRTTRYINNHNYHILWVDVLCVKCILMHATSFGFQITLTG